MSQSVTTRADRGRSLGKEGYALSFSVTVPDLAFVHKPKNAGVYAVDLLRGCCTCPDFTRRSASQEAPSQCKHLVFVGCCLRYAQSIGRKPAARKLDMKRRFSKGHIARLRQATIKANEPQTRDFSPPDPCRVCGRHEGVQRADGTWGCVCETEGEI